VYLGPEGVLTGSMRLAQEAREKAEAKNRQQEAARKRQAAQRKRSALEAQIAALEAELVAEEGELTTADEEQQQRAEQLAAERIAMSHIRRADVLPKKEE
jgi:circadian clock protein KaiC